MKRVAIVVVAGLLAGGTACNIKQYALRQSAKMMLVGMAAVNEEPDFEMIRAALPGNLKTLEILLRSDPTNPDMLFMLSQGYGAYSQIVLEDDLDLADAAGDVERANAIKARAGLLYKRAQDFAARILPAAVIKTFETAPIEQVKAAAAKLTKDDLVGLYWYAFAWIGRINLDQSNPERIGELPRAEALIHRCGELDPNYFNGLPLLTAGALASARPPMFGGDLAKGKDLFEKGIAVSKGRFLLGKFLYARFWAVQAQDRAAFCRLLDEVVAAPDDALPEQQMMNNVAKRWALRWRDRAGSLFAEGGTGGCVAPAPGSGTKTEDDDGSLQ